MVIYCSNLPNDQDMIQALGSAAIPAPIKFGDCFFFGVGDSDELLRVCVERKKVRDMASCIISGRYLNQLQSAKDEGKMDVLALVIERRYRPSPTDGLLEVLGYDKERGRSGWIPVVPEITFSRFDQYLTELQYLVGIIVKYAENVRETAAVIKALWDNFQTAPSDHQSLKVFYKPTLSVLLHKPSIVRRVAAELPGIGWERSRVVAEHFPTVKAMCDAGESDWIELDGVGKKTAERVVRALRGGLE